MRSLGGDEPADYRQRWPDYSPVGRAEWNHRMVNNMKRKANTSKLASQSKLRPVPGLRPPQARSGAETKAQMERVNSDYATVHRIMTEPGPRWEPQPSTGNESWRYPSQPGHLGRRQGPRVVRKKRRKLMSAGGVNIAILVGRATSDPTVRVVKGGVAQAVFNMTTNEVWFDKESNERREKVISHRVVVYGPLANAVGKCVRKQCLVFVQGQIETRRWVGKDGSRGENWTTEIIVQGWSGRVTVLDFAGELVRSEPEQVEDELSDSPTPLSIKRSAAKYGDADMIDANLSFMAQQKEQTS